MALPIASAQAQVNGPGPSDPALFDTVINLPVDQATISSSVGNELGDATPTTQLNVADGGTIESGFNAYAGSELNISGGVIGSGFQAQPGSEANISGGRIGTDFNALTGSSVQLVGGQFQLNGEDYGGSTIDLVNRWDVFSGVLADGSPFVFSNWYSDELEGVTLVTTDLPTVDTTPIVVNADSNDVYGVSPGQTLTLQTGGFLNDFVSVGATLNIEGGSIYGIEAVNSVINIEASDFLGISRLRALGESTVNIDGGSVTSSIYVSHGSIGNVNNVDSSSGSTSFLAENGGVFNIRGGIARRTRAGDGGVVNISGGKFIGSSIGGVRTLFGGITNISGGDFSLSFFEVEYDGQLNLFGTEFYLDGVSLQDSLSLDQAYVLTDRDDAILTGTLADGGQIEITLDALGSFNSDRIGGLLTLTLVSDLTGDYNSDGFVSQADLDLVLLNWGETVLPFEFNQAGLNGGPFDGLVSQNELDAVLLNWGEGTAPDFNVIPEPATGGAVLLGLACVARRGRRWW